MSEKCKGQDVVTLTELHRQTAAIRAALTRHCLTQVWLINRLAQEGVVTDKFEMSSILSNTRTGPKVDGIIKKSLSILSAYDESMRRAHHE